MRILLLSNMYPSQSRPDYGVFVARMADALRAAGHEVDEAVIRDDRRGRLRTPLKYLRLLGTARSLARRTSPDVVYAHYLVPTGIVAALTGVPFVVTAHGGDVENARGSLPLRWATRWVIRRAAAVICVSEYLALRLPEAPQRLAVIDSGVDTHRFAAAPRHADGGPRFLFVGSLTERKNVDRLIDAFVRLGEGSLVVAGSGPLEEELRSRAAPGVRFAGRLNRDEVASALRDADILCLPSIVEPFGQAALEALASGRPVVATRVGGPPEYLTEACGVLVDPLDVDSIANGLRRAMTLPVPCPAALTVAREHDVDRQAARVAEVLRAVSSSHDDG